MLQSISVDNKFTQVNCAQCNIELITSCSNRNRTDILCIFGCREHHLKEQSNKRSAAYYSTDEGKIKKSALNQNRKLDKKDKDEKSQEFELSSTSQNPPPLSMSLLFNYLRLFIIFFSKQSINCQELINLIAQVDFELRQHGLDYLLKNRHFTGYG